MKVKVINSSSRRTREKIKKAFAQLLEENNNLNITVTELAKKAEITRSAFYTHYDNIYDVARDIQDETLEVLKVNNDILKSLDNIDSYFDNIFKYLKDNEDIYSMILSSNEPIRFTTNLNKIISKNLYDILNHHNIKNLELNISLFIDGSINLMIKHYKKEINYSLDEINTYMKETFRILFLNNK